MAKTTKCAFCGAEVTTGLFSGTAIDLDLTQPVPCCASCNETFGKAVVEREDRLKTKIENLKKSTRAKLSNEDIAMLVKKYLAEEEQQREKVGNRELTKFHYFCRYDDDGHFTAHEFLLSNFLDGDSSAESIQSSMITSMNIDTLTFTKDDITRIEYRKATKLGASTGMFSEMHSYEIRLNDAGTFTYKPCITRLGVSGNGLLPFLAAKDAEKKTVEILEQFKQIIGSDLPIVKVKKFY